MYIRKRIRPSGKTSYSVSFKHPRTGKWTERTAGPRRKDAELLANRIREEVNAGTFEVAKDNPLFGEFLDHFLAAKRRQVKPRTLEDYESTLKKHALPFFGDVYLSEITPARVQAFLSRLEEKGVSPATAGKAFRYLKTVLRHALSLEIIERDPTLAIKAPRKPRPEIDFLTPEEVSRLLEAAEGDLEAILSVACLAGLRVGEICGLKWKDIDFEAGTIKVVRSYDPRHGFSEPKSSYSRRAVPMTPRLAATLSEHYRRRGRPGPEDLVFPNSLGKPKDRNALVHREFKAALERAGLRHIRFHDLRHTYASLAVAAGMDLKALQAAMGHSSITMTADHYAHLYGGAYDRPLARMDALLSPGEKVIPFPGRRGR